MSNRVVAPVSMLVAAAVLGYPPPSFSGQTASSPVKAPVAATAKAKPPALPRTSWGAPDLQGLWSTSTTTPMERPAELAGKEFLTPEEAAAWSKRVVDNRNTDKRRQGNADVTAAYNDIWYDYGTKYLPTLRTSLVIDPPDGRVPALTPEGQKRVSASIPNSGFQDARVLNSWLDRGVWERCITRGVPDVMMPTAYNNNYQIFQTRDYVAILAEMIHDVRIIPLDGRPHVASSIQQWMGDARGHWEGDTLVIDTTNFTGKTNFRGANANMHLTERLTRLGPGLLRYQATVDDPTTFTRPWTFEITATPTEGRMYEYACHEGNSSMEHALSASRVREKELAEAAAKQPKN